MTNDKKLRAADLASIKGGAAKGGARASGLARGSSGRTNAALKKPSSTAPKRG